MSMGSERYRRRQGLVDRSTLIGELDVKGLPMETADGVGNPLTGPVESVA